jgi:carbamoyltransferase
MGDGGLAVGAGLAACVPGVLDETMPAVSDPLGVVFLGPVLTIVDVDAALLAAGLEPESLDDIAPLVEAVADLLADGYVVARAAGRMEYGPRALGNRSILYHPADPSVNDWLNINLKRTEFMPFAPAVLWEHREACFEGLEGAELAARFMTVTFRCTPWMAEHMPGVVHIDGTARPQLVHRAASPGFHDILDAFHRRTGLPGVVNTSFNMHEEPIVCSADDCVRAFLAARIDYLAIGPYLVKHPNQDIRERRVLDRSAGVARC